MDFNLTSSDAYCEVKSGKGYTTNGKTLGSAVEWRVCT